MNLALEKPILRWAGGKWKLIKTLKNYLPDDVKNRFYREPFLGAGSFFFIIQPNEALISDANEHLISCYRNLASHPELINKYLRHHKKNTNEKYYYKIRDQYNNSKESIAQAARFIYLNRTSFNGIFRVNQKGKFNVPYGWKEPPAIPPRERIIKASNILKKATIKTLQFENALDSISKNDFIYFDPPYPPINGTSFFTHYTKERFNEKDQRKLADIMIEIDKVGCKFMISNADTELIRNIYKKFNIVELSVIRWVTSKSVKHRVSELVITNYDNFLNL